MTQWQKDITNFYVSLWNKTVIGITNFQIFVCRAMNLKTTALIGKAFHTWELVLLLTVLTEILAVGMFQITPFIVKTLRKESCLPKKKFSRFKIGITNIL